MVIVISYAGVQSQESKSLTQYGSLLLVTIPDTVAAGKDAMIVNSLYKVSTNLSTS